jgi:NADPH2:quinone reductase
VRRREIEEAHAMRAVAIEDFKVGPTAVEVPMPEPGPGEALVKVAASSVNGFDVAAASGMLQGMMEHRFPVVLGKDFAGTIEEVGDGVSSVAPGDQVFGVLMREFMGDGTFGEYVIVPAAIGLAKMPPGLDHAVAGALGLAGAAAAAAIDALAPSTGQTVLIAGATGGVGALAIQLAHARGAHVIATARPGEEARFVTGLGADSVIDYTNDVETTVRSGWPAGVDAALHLAGDAQQLARLVRPGGRFASTLGVGADQLETPDFTATAVMAMPSAGVLDLLAADVAAGKLLVPIQHTYQLEDVPQAIVDFARGTLGKLAIAIVA